MPTIWRYQLRNFLAIICLTIAATVGLIILIKIQTFARFFAMGAPALSVGRLVLLQLPEAMPLSIAIGCLLASSLMALKMSQTGELAALRASGLTLLSIFTPLYYLSTLLFLLSLAISSQIIPISRAATYKLIENSSTVQPLLILKKGGIGKGLRAYIEMHLEEGGRSGRDILIAFPTNNASGMGLLLAKKVDSINSDTLVAKDVALLTALEGDGFALDQQNRTEISTESLAPFINPTYFVAKKKRIDIRGSLGTKELLKEALGGNPAYISALVHQFALAALVPLFTYIGTIYGTQIGRSINRRKLITLILISICLIVSLFMAKSRDRILILALPLYTIVPLFALFFTMREQKRIERGLE